MDYDIIQNNINNYKDYINVYSVDDTICKNFEEYYNVLNNSNSDSFKSDFASNVLDLWINIYIDNPTNEVRDQCKVFINFINTDDNFLRISFVLYYRDCLNSLSRFLF